MNFISGSQHVIYIQLRDEQMRLLAFFHPAKLEHILKEEGLSHLLPVISKQISTCKPGKFIHINTTPNA